ncbi:hypothetical protein [Mycobacterium kiyosense]|uniref:hypothetical protein n=1 Tax=Mycobacterium kiyosense TaxID=2871094 RepID=UPI00222E05AE|nr:hypothetical protein [Mycobacterium kiyosense]
MVAAAWVLAIAAHSDVLRPVSQTFHPAHALVSSLGGEFATNIDHPHLGNGSSAAHHEAFVSVVLPNSTFTALAARGVAVPAVAGVGVLRQQVMLAGRGPPRGFAAALAGQDLLTRFCLSRR